MPEKKIKSEMIAIGRELKNLGFIPATDGNISFRNKDRIIITASGVSKGDLSYGDFLTVDLKGQVIQRSSKEMQPTMELQMHLAVYESRQDINAIIHAHPPYVTALTLAGLKLDEKLLPEIEITLGKVPISKHAWNEKKKKPEISRLIKKHRAIILEKHGALTTGENLVEALHHMERLEHAAKIISISSTLKSSSK